MKHKQYISERGDYMETFQDYAYYYNMFYKDKDYVGEAKQIS